MLAIQQTIQPVIHAGVPQQIEGREARLFPVKEQISELRPVKGIDIVGPLPPGAQIETVFVAAIPK